MRKTNKMLSLLLALVMVLGMLPTAAFAATAGPVTEVFTESDSPLQINKKVTDNGDGTYKIAMESYVTGSVQQSTPEPLDIVLVLDQSGSMAYNFSGDSTNNNASRRQYAMKQAVQNFIDEVGENSSDHRVALVTFGSNANKLKDWTTTDTTGVTSLKSAVNGLPNSPSGATDVGKGMTQAKTLLNSARSNAQKIVIVFTDGVPTDSSDFSTTVADSALATAKDMKDNGATIYTVGIFSGADPTQLYGATGFDTNSNGTVGSKWIEDNWGLFPGNDFSKSDGVAGNRFLNYLSNNSTDADSIGLTRETSGLGIIHSKITYTINANHTWNNNGYYLTAEDSNTLTNVFAQIAEYIVPSVEADENTVLVDTLSDFFLFNVEDSAVTGVSVKEATASGTGAVPTWTEATSTLNLEFNDSTVSVTGFDYSANPVVKGSEVWSGEKLIVSFDIAPNPNAAWVYGANLYDTNESAGLYDAAGSDLGELTQSPQVEITAYKVCYAFDGASPEEADLPDSKIYLAGAPVAVHDGYEDIAVKDSTNTYVIGTWSFNGWDEEDFTMPDEDVEITGTWTYTEAEPFTPDEIKIPIEKIIRRGGNVNPSAETFEFIVSWIAEGDAVISGNTIKTYGTGTYPGEIVITFKDAVTLANYQRSGLEITEKQGSADDWTYSNAKYYIYAERDTSEDTAVSYTGKWLIDSSTAEWSTGQNAWIYNRNNGSNVGKATFTNIYTKNTPIIPPSDPDGTAVLVKVDANDNDTYLSGAKFELYRVYSNSSRLVGTYTTNRNGKISASVDAGNYYWLEVGAPEGYTLDSTKHEFTVRNYNTTTVMVKNSKTNVPDVFATDHYAYVIGYDDGLVHPEANITRAEVATIFFRLLSDEVRNANLTKVNSFSDVASTAWYNTAVSTMAKMGIINGYPDGTFGPNNSITRAEFAAIAARFDEYGNSTGASFTDIYGHWAMKEISIAANNGWVLGYEDGTFKPDQKITRAEAMTMVNRVLQRIPESKYDLLTGMVTWPDNADTKKWYYLMVQEATNSHYYERKTNGYEYWTELRPVRDWATLER